METEETPAVPEVPDKDFEVEGPDAQEETEAKPEAQEAKSAPVEEEPDNLAAAPAEEEPKEEAPEPEKEPEKPANPRHDARARVMKATKREAEERELRLAAEAKVAELEARVKGPQPAATDEKPTPEQFQTYEEFVEALTDWKTERKIRQFQEKDQQARVEAERNRLLENRVESYKERMGAVLEEDPEFLDKVDPELQDLRPTFMLAPNETPGPENDVAQAVFESEHPVELMLYLSAHPEEMVRLSGLPDSFAVARAMGALEAKATETPKPRLVPPPEQEAPVSKAKPPVKPLGGSPQPSEEDVTDDMSFDEHMRVMTAKERRTQRNM